MVEVFFFGTANCSENFLNAKPLKNKLKLDNLKKKESGVARTQTHDRGSVPLLVAANLFMLVVLALGYSNTHRFF